MDTVTTALGHTFQTDFVSAIDFPPLLYIRVVGSNIADVATVFGNKEETKSIIAGGHEYRQYVLDALIPEGSAIRVNLRKE